ncbi:Glycerol-3-phosphate dehydrogenase mitochondrial [Bienertia sinuspersici]
MLRVSTMKKVNTMHEVPETSKGKAKKVKRNLDVQLDEDSGSGAERNDASEQDNDSGSGISSVKKKKAKPLNVNCRVEQFGLLMEGLEGEKMEVVESMGFGHLKHLSGQAMNKELGYWLMTRVNADTGELMAGDGREFTLSSEQVQCVLGIPKGERPVPLQMDDTNRVEIEKICRWFSKVEYGKACISIVDAKEYVLGEEVDSENFGAHPTLCAAEEASQYDWCSFVLDFLLRRARAFSHSFDTDGYAVGCGGCTYFLVIFYLDRLRRPPVRWGEYPRVKVFHKDLLKNVAEADRRNSGDFGKTKSVDVAYGEVHPRAARDIYPTESLTFAEEVANHIGEAIRTEVGVVVDVVSRVIGEQNVRREDDRLCISADRRTTTDDATAKSSIPVTNKVHVSSSTLPPNSTITSTTVTANVYGSSPSIPSTIDTVLPPKTAKVAIHPTPQNPPNVNAMLNPPITATSHPCTRAAVARSFALKVTDIEQFIFRWSSIKRKQNARRSCYGVLSPVGYVDSQYVPATAALNTRIWYKKYDSKCTRMMCDPSIAEKQKFITKFAEKIDCDVHDIDKIFLPVVIQEHWICLLFAVKEHTIWVLDSLFPDPVSQHQDAINKLVDGVDVLLSVLSKDKSWSKGVIQQWPKHAVTIQQQKDIDTTIPMQEDVDKARKDLLLRHLFCDFNEKKNELSNIVRL